MPGPLQCSARTTSTHSSHQASLLERQSERSLTWRWSPRGMRRRFTSNPLGLRRGRLLRCRFACKTDLRYVLCMWRRSDDFTPEQLHALGLMGRMIELALRACRSSRRGPAAAGGDTARAATSRRRQAAGLLAACRRRGGVGRGHRAEDGDAPAGATRPASGRRLSMTSG